MNARFARMPVMLLALVAALWPNAGGAQNPDDPLAGFDADSIARFIAARKQVVTGLSSAPQRDVRADKLRAAARRFRRTGYADPSLIGRTHATRTVADRLLASTAAQRTPEIWRYFFHGALVHVGRVAAPISRVGFYNPYVDGWLMTDWGWRVGEPALMAMRVVAGDRFRGESAVPSKPVAWGRSGRAPKALYDAAALSAFAFARAHPVAASADPQGGGADDRALIEARLLVALAGLAHHIRSSDYATASNAFLAAARAGDTASLGRLAPAAGVQATHAVAGLPSMLRDQLELAGHFPTSSGAIVTYSAAAMPRWLVMTLYQSVPPGGLPLIARVTIVDFAPGLAADGGAR